MGQAVTGSCDVERAPCAQLQKGLESTCVAVMDIGEHDDSAEGFTEELLARPSGNSKGSKKPLMVGQRRSNRSDGVTRLMAAAQYGSVEGIHRLYAEGEALDARDVRGWTALHFAAYELHYDAYVTLVQLGADPQLQNFMGQTPVKLAAAVDPERAQQLSQGVRAV
ncbi:unnamed protein product [Effrenium voratum]|nr:unnamed protein product [Effrenium voratum]